MRLRLLLYFDDLIVLKFALYAHFTPVPIFLNTFHHSKHQRIYARQHVEKFMIYSMYISFFQEPTCKSQCIFERENYLK